MDPYEGFAERYDLSFGSFGKQDLQVVEFFRQIFAENHVRTVLDCACGTGRHLPLFHSLGCEVIGSDVSKSMLSMAGKNLAEAGLDMPLFQIDFRDLPLQFAQPFDAVVCLAAISFMPGENEFLRAFESMGQALCSEGILILTTMPTERQCKEKPRFVLTSNTRDFSRLFVMDYLENKVHYDILDIFHTDERRELQVWSAELYPLLMDDQERLLKAAGFQKVKFYGGFDFSVCDKETSNSLITVARK